MKSSNFKIVIIIFTLIFIYILTFTYSKEGFTWKDKLTQDYLKSQNTYNPDYVFDTNILQKQASPEEVQYFLKNKKWYWSPETQKLYKESVMRDNIISIDPEISLNIAQGIYNEQAVKQVLSWKTKEGLFILNGITIGHTKDLPENINNVVKCDIQPDGTHKMKKITNLGYGSINGEMIKKIDEINDEDIPKNVPGFHFLKSPCNPCIPLNGPTNYSCPFSINVGDGNGVSNVWKNLWNIKE